MKLKANPRLLFSLGLAAIFLANGLSAWLTPAEFKEIIGNSSLLKDFLNPDLLVKLIGFNDIALAVLISLRKWSKLVSVWAGTWVAGVILVTGVWNPETFSHLGVLALIVYYRHLSTS